MKVLLSLCIICFIWVNGPAEAITIPQAIDIALQHNPEIARAEAFANASYSRSLQAKAPFWPKIELNYMYRDADLDPRFDGTEFSSTATNATYNLFNGGSDWFRMHAAKSRQHASKWGYQSVIADIVLAVRQAYIEVLRAEKNLLTSEQSMTLLKRQYREAELRLDQGLIAKNDLLRVAVEMATAEQNMIAAQSELVVRRENLSRVMGLPLSDQENLSPVHLNVAEQGSPEELKTQMLASRSELKFLRLQLAAQVLDRKAIHGDFLPEIDLVLGYERIGNGAFPESSDRDYESDTTTMLQASWTLFSGFDTYHELASLKYEIVASKEDIRDTENRLILQLKNALEEYRVALTNLDTAKTSVLQAEENYRVNENRFKAKVATTVDLLDAQEFLTRARNEEIKAQYDLYNADAVIDRILEKEVPQPRRQLR